jgi:hypothetical protein
VGAVRGLRAAACRAAAGAAPPQRGAIYAPSYGASTHTPHLDLELGCSELGLVDLRRRSSSSRPSRATSATRPSSASPRPCWTRTFASPTSATATSPQTIKRQMASWAASARPRTEARTAGSGTPTGRTTSASVASTRRVAPSASPSPTSACASPWSGIRRGRPGAILDSRFAVMQLDIPFIKVSGVRRNASTARV